MAAGVGARRGSPLAVLGVVLVAWVGTRAAMWDNPFVAFEGNLPSLIAERDIGRQTDRAQPMVSTEGPVLGVGFSRRWSDSSDLNSGFAVFAGARLSTINDPATEQSRGFAPFVTSPHSFSRVQGPLAKRPQFSSNDSTSTKLAGQTDVTPPFTPPPTGSARLERWSLDAWAFWRQGSSSPAISQGRVPIYGASQIGANLQFRLAPKSRRDPRLYTRAYRALVSGGETEFAAGVSAKFLPSIPIRAQAEIRLTENQFGSEARPSAFLVTEFAPQRLPGGLVAEAYAQGGYVGGKSETAFADGQIVMTREVTQFDLTGSSPAKVSVGAGAWGGAQRDVTRLDVGPTVRLDITIGKVPARLSLDWREQVAGDASPGSGGAATLSTRF